MQRFIVALGFAVLGLVWTSSAAPAPSAAGANGLSFIHDDYPGALQRARAEKLPLVVKIWSPW